MEIIMNSVDKRVYHFKELFQKDIAELLNGPVDTSIETVTADVDRGVQCWETFIEILQERFPNMSILVVDQNYSYHSGNCCNIRSHAVNMKDEVLEAFQVAKNLKYLYINDCQTDFSFMRENQVRITIKFEDGKKLVIDRTKYLDDGRPNNWKEIETTIDDLDVDTGENKNVVIANKDVTNDNENIIIDNLQSQIEKELGEFHIV